MLVSRFAEVVPFGSIALTKGLTEIGYFKACSLFDTHITVYVLFRYSDVLVQDYYKLHKVFGSSDLIPKFVVPKFHSLYHNVYYTDNSYDLEKMTLIAHKVLLDLKDKKKKITLSNLLFLSKIQPKFKYLLSDVLSDFLLEDNSKQLTFDF